MQRTMHPAAAVLFMVLITAKRGGKRRRRAPCRARTNQTWLLLSEGWQCRAATLVVVVSRASGVRLSACPPTPAWRAGCRAVDVPLHAERLACQAGKELRPWRPVDVYCYCVTRQSDRRQHSIKKRRQRLQPAVVGGDICLQPLRAAD